MRLRIAALAAVLLAARAATAVGFRFKASTHSEGTASAAISMADVDVDGWVDGEKARVEIVKSRNPLLPRGDALLTLDGGKTFSLLDPPNRTFSSWTPPERAGGKKTAASFVQVRFANAEVEKLDEGPGPKIAGQETRRLKLRISYVSEVNVMGSVQKTPTTRIEELWTAPRLTDTGFAVWLRKESTPTGDAAFDAKIGAALSAAPGVPLKRVTTTTWKDPGGKDQRVKTTLSVWELQKAPAPAALFELPPVR